MLVSVLIAARDRPGPLVRCLESVLAQDYPHTEILVLDDASASHRLCEVVAGLRVARPLRCFRSDVHLGVAAGRNFLFGRAQGELLCVIDDDAYLPDPGTIARIVEACGAYPDAGIFAFKVVDNRNGRRDLLVPFPVAVRRRHPGVVDRPGLVSYYVGTFHAIRRTVVERCGAYHEELIFGEEELDLAFRAIAAGFAIVYLPGVVAHHAPQPPIVPAAGGGELRHHVRNRFFLAYRYLPWHYLPVYLLVWLARYAARAVREGELPAYLRGVAAGVRVLRRTPRTPLRGAALRYVRAHHGRLWY